MSLKSLIKVANYYDLKYGFNKAATNFLKLEELVNGIANSFNDLNKFNLDEEDRNKLALELHENALVKIDEFLKRIGRRESLANRLREIASNEGRTYIQALLMDLADYAEGLGTIHVRRPKENRILN
jgi:hypothetical protein